MFRNQYDSDVTVWSPQGRIHQIEYAMEAVKQGSATVGLKSKTHAVVVALKRASNELSSHQKKVFQIDDHVGVSCAGLLCDARLLARYMQTQCLNWRWSHNEAMPIHELMDMLGSKMQVNTQRYGRRPFGVGFLVGGYDENGPNIYQTCPSANVYDCKSMSIGARSQSARTYLEKHLEEFAACTLEQLIRHALLALRESLPNELTLSTKNTTVMVVGKAQKFEIYDDAAVEPYLESIRDEPRLPPAPAAAEGEGAGGEEPAGEPAPADQADA